MHGGDMELGMGSAAGIGRPGWDARRKPGGRDGIAGGNRVIIRMEYSITYVNEVIGGRWIRFYADDAVSQLLLDSRRLIFPVSTLFFALKGARRDGGRYVEELYHRGVRNFVVGEGWEGSELPGANIIGVGDALVALQTLVAAHRKHFALPVIGITGS